MSTRNLVWLASFPKSGNTWVRSFIGTYLSGAERTDLSLAYGYSRSESRLVDFARAAGKALHELTPHDIAAQRQAVQEHLSRVGEPLVVKTHNARLDGDFCPLIFSRYTRAGIYVVRNPLDIVDSLADHADRTHDDVIRLLNRRSHVLLATELHAEQYLGTWSHHVRTWVRNKEEFPLLVLRYEDLHADPLAQFIRLIRFLEWDLDPARLRRAVELTSFESLQRAEDASGFAEKSPAARSGRFFRHGRPGRFSEVLSAEQTAQVVRDHGAAMRMVGYE
jgi:hypothetical protein